MQRTPPAGIRQPTFGWDRVAATAFSHWALLTLMGCALLSVAKAAPRPEEGKPLQIYFVDVEGGQATLFVTPEGKSLLVDTGWPDSNGRDADRIMAAAKLAGIKQLDFVLLTHYHIDHAGKLRDRKSTRLNSSHRCTSYAVFCSKKKTHRSMRPRPAHRS